MEVALVTLGHGGGGQDMGVGVALVTLGHGGGGCSLPCGRPNLARVGTPKGLGA